VVPEKPAEAKVKKLVVAKKGSTVHRTKFDEPGLRRTATGHTKVARKAKSEQLPVRRAKVSKLPKPRTIKKNKKDKTSKRAKKHMNEIKLLL